MWSPELPMGSAQPAGVFFAWMGSPMGRPAPSRADAVDRFGGLDGAQHHGARYRFDERRRLTLIRRAGTSVVPFQARVGDARSGGEQHFGGLGKRFRIQR